MTAPSDIESLREPVAIGALARATGITVRALHHYDAIGLLVPAERSSSGRRLYSTADVQRLYRIVALRELGLSLPEIAAALQGGDDLAVALRDHLARVRASIEQRRRLAATLDQILEHVERRRSPTLEDLLTAIEGISMTDRHYTTEQRHRLAERRDQLGDERIEATEHEWGQLIAAVERERAAGTAPDAPRMAELARRWKALIEQFTGGDEDIRQSLQTMYREQGSAAASRGMVDPELMAYMGRALAALEGPGQCSHVRRARRPGDRPPRTGQR